MAPQGPHRRSGHAIRNGEYRFASVADGTTVSLALDRTLTGWKRLVMGRAVHSTMNAEVHTLDSLMTLLEA